MNEKFRTALRCEHLEDRTTPATATLSAAGVLTITGDAGNDRIRVTPEGGDLLVLDGTVKLGTFSSAGVTSIIIDGGSGKDSIIVGALVTQPVTINGGDDNDKLVAGGGTSNLNGGAGNDSLFGGTVNNTFDGGDGADDLYKVLPNDTVIADPADRILEDLALPGSVSAPQQVLTASEVDILLQRAAAASASNDGIIVITDRNGRILGVRVESGVDPAITGDPEKLVFAIDGAVSLARTGAFFGNNQAPLTSRTVGSLSQSTMTEREVNSDPNITDPNSTLRGPGFVAAVGTKGHFPPGVANTPQVDLFQIEHTNRDQTYSPGPDKIIGTADDELRLERFNADPAFVTPGQELFPPDSYGIESGVAPRTANGIPIAQGRGIATLPGGIPIFKNGQSVGGIGVFFPGKTGFATEENSALSITYDPTKPDRSLEAEWMAFAAVGGFQGPSLSPGFPLDPVNVINGVPLPQGIGLPAGRIDLVGITLDIVGPGGQNGISVINAEGVAVGRGDPNDGTNQILVAGQPGLLTRDGLPVPDGWLVLPHDGDGVSAADVVQIVNQGIAQADVTRAAIRLPLGTRTKMVFAVSDRQGNIVGLYREPDATVFSLDVAVAKARNTAYYANASQLQAIDQVNGVPAGTAIEARTIRYLALPRFPESVQGAPPGPFSQLNDGGVDPLTGLMVGPPLPASAYQSVVGYDAFNPGTNFRAPTNINNQDGIVFFPGAAPLYKNGQLIGGVGVSGDGVDQDDVMTIASEAGFYVPTTILRADQVLVNGIRLPYQKTNRNPEG
ncbi:MAG: heme-binding protein [Planctomycetes bacterium]|nr:heme-binding protein [Planctomycetota bacterium]